MAIEFKTKNIKIHYSPIWYSQKRMDGKIKNQKGFIQIPLLIAIIVGVLVIGGASYFGVKQYQNYQAEKIEKEKTAQEIQQQKDSEVENLKKEVEALKKMSSTKVGSDNISIIKEWRPRVAFIDSRLFLKGIIWENSLVQDIFWVQIHKAEML